MDSRIQEHLQRLVSDFPDTIVSADCTYLILPQFALPPHLFTVQHTRLLILIPPTYPIAPADNFYVTWGLALQSGHSINNFSGPVQLFSEQWGTFSFHVADDGWNPNNDNFLTFLTAVRNRLQEGA